MRNMIEAAARFIEQNRTKDTMQAKEVREMQPEEQRFSAPVIKVIAGKSMQEMAKEILARTHSYFAHIPVSLLTTDTYQRTYDPNRSAVMASNLNHAALGVIMVSYRDGLYYVFDGQHRGGAAALVDPEYIMDCKVHTGLTRDEEIVLYEVCNLHRKNVPKGQAFKSRLERSESVAMAIKGVVESCGFTLHFQATRRDPANVMVCFTALEHIYLGYGSSALLNTMSLINSVWPGDKSAKMGVLLLGVNDFLVRYNKEINMDHLVSRLRRVKVHVVLQEANSMHGMVGGRPTIRVSKSILSAYNSGLRNRRMIDKYDQSIRYMPR